MTCAEFQRKLSAYLDGELSRWTRWKIDNHMRHCPDCASMLRELDEVDMVMRGAAAAEPAPAYLTHAVMQRLPAMPPAWRPRPQVVRWATGVALVGVQVVSIYGAYLWGTLKGTTPGGRVGNTAELTSPVSALGTGALRGSVRTVEERAPASQPANAPARWSPGRTLWGSSSGNESFTPAANAPDLTARLEVGNRPASRPQRKMPVQPKFQFNGVPQ